jgi:hypothetical protein
MNIKSAIKKIAYTLLNNNRVVLLDYAIKPTELYTPNAPHQAIQQLIERDSAIIEANLQSTVKYKEAILAINKINNESNEQMPTWNNGFLPGLDIIMLYSIIAQNQPKNYVEIGSGNSTKVVRSCIKTENLSTKITSIDPYPRKNIDNIVDVSIRKPVQNVDVAIFKNLQKGDVVFFDGTHTLYPNSDVQWFFLEVLPVLPVGVIVQIHDIYLPYDYPSFMLERYYNEQYILATALINAPLKYEIVAPNFAIFKNDKWQNLLNPLWQSERLKDVERHGGSFWFKIK